MNVSQLVVILLTPCFTAKNMQFGKLQWRTTMENQDFLFLYNMSIDDCHQECKSRPHCRSFNYYHSDWCWLNGVSRLEPQENIQKKPGFVFSDREEWNMDKNERDTDADEELTSIKECGMPAPIGSSVILGNRNTFGSKAKYMCYRQGKLIDSSVVTCLRNGSWSKDNKFTCPGRASCLENYQWYEKRSFCYFIGDTCETWSESREICQKQGGDLLIIPDDETFEFAKLTAFKGICDGLWIGATDEAEEGVWIWVTGQPMNFTRWKPGQPDNWNNEDCAELKKSTDFSWELMQTVSSYGFNDFKCNGKQNYICQAFL